MDRNDRDPETYHPNNCIPFPPPKIKRLTYGKLGNVILDEHGVLALNPTFIGCSRQSWMQEMGHL